MLVVAYRFVAPNPYDLALGASIGVTAIAAVGLTLAIGGAGQLALGQAGFMAIGAYSTAVLTTEHHMIFLLALLLSTVLCTLGGAALGWIAMRLKGNYLAMATLAVGSIVYSLLLVTPSLGGANGFLGIPPPEIGSWTAVQPAQQYTLVAIALVLTCGLSAAFLATRRGPELAAIRDDEGAAKLIGINVTLRKVQIFALSAALAGISGSILASVQGIIDPSLFQPGESITLFIIVALGGMGSITGAVLGAALVSYVTQEITGAGAYALTALGAIVILFMAVLPGGVATIPERLRVRWMRWRDSSGPVEKDPAGKFEGRAV
jgi:branched-chain amino acid transport system permease protein